MRAAALVVAWFLSVLAALYTLAISQAAASVAATFTACVLAYRLGRMTRG